MGLFWQEGVARCMHDSRETCGVNLTPQFPNRPNEPNMPNEPNRENWANRFGVAP